MQRPQFSSDVSHAALREQIKKFNASSEEERAAYVDDFGKEFLMVAQYGNSAGVAAFIEEAFPVNYQDKRNRQTALHYAAAADARDVIRVLVSSGKCDYLLRDIWGRLPSEVAYLSGDDPALARLLGNKERKQARAQGIKLTRRPA
jgi:ankyrin repeat protein